MYCDMMTEIINQVALKPHTGPERDEVRENCIMKSFMVGIPLLIGVIK